MAQDRRVRACTHDVCLLAFVLLVLVGATPSQAWAATPWDALLEKLKPQGPVSDFAGILTPADRKAIEDRLSGLRQKSGAHLVVAVLKSLEGGEVKDFTNKLFAKWGVGEKGKNNGVLLLVAMQDRKARIEVGYGLEPVLPDALTGRILDEQFVPAFKQGRYAQGLTQTVNRIAEILERGEPARPAPRARAVPLFAQVFTLLFFAIWTTVAAFSVGVGIGTRTAPPIVSGGFVAAIGLGFCCLGKWWQEAPLLPYVIPPYALVVVVAGWIMGIMGWVKPETFRGSSGRSRGWNRGGGGSSWSSGGFSSDSGGFSGGCDSGSFGGGSSGGGGADRSW